jgi:hypothetical protein
VHSGPSSGHRRAQNREGPTSPPINRSARQRPLPGSSLPA